MCILPAVYAIQIMKEDFLHYVWKYQKFDASRAVSLSGEKVNVVHPGQYLKLSGPDFFNARVEIDGQMWAGNIEIHVRSSDWYHHQHEADPAYENIILHVVWEHDVGVFRRDGSEIPVLELHSIIDDGELERYQELLRPKRWIYCEQHIGSVEPLVLTQFIDRLWVERLEKKSAPILQWLRRFENDWESVFFVALARGFGLNTNGETFEDIAASIPFSIFRKEAGDPLHLEALLFDRTGWLDGEATDGYMQDLRERRDFLFAKYGLGKVQLPKPEFFKHRPDNFPTVRLAQLVQLYHRRPNLFSMVMACEHLADYYRIFRVGVSAYWESHYYFGRGHPQRNKTISPSFVDLLLINTVLPVKFVYLRLTQLGGGDAVAETFAALKPERNGVIDRFAALGVASKTAFDTQAMLHLKNEYCENSRCLECQIGLELLRPRHKSS